MKKYIRYYFLGDYLFKEINRNFHKNKYLTPEEFLAIVIWKRNASKTKVIKGLKAGRKSVKSITNEVYKAKNREDKLKILCKIKGLGIAISSAILTVLYPDEFTVVDYRAINSLGDLVNGKPGERLEDYLNYVDVCKKEAARHHLSLRDFDRALWGKDFYEGKNGLKEVAKNIT